MMETRYVAYGLELRSSFGLPGMVSTDTEALPPLALELVTPAEVQEMWSGAAGEPAWRGRLGDGGSLMIERGKGGDVLFTHGHWAHHRLDPRGLELAVAPLREGLEWQRTLVTKVLSSISVMRGYEALHASAVNSPWGAVAVAAPTGTGKTTLALELIRRGWPLLTDDVLPLEASAEGVVAHAGTPHMNVAVDSWGELAEGDLGHTLAMLAGERWVAAADVARVPCPVRAVCLLERSRGLPLDVQALSANPLHLSPYILGLPGDVERERRKFDLYADLADSAMLMRVTCDVGVGPVYVADLIERALVEQATGLVLGEAP